MRKYNTLSDSVAIDLTTIGTGDPLNALELVQDFVLDYCANTDGISDELVMAYNCFVQDLADDVSKAKEDAEFQAELEALPQGWEYEADGFDRTDNNEVVVFADLPMMASF